MTAVPARKISPVLISWLTRPSVVESPVQDQSEAISETKESSPGMPHGGPPGLDYGNPIVARMDWSPGSC